MGSKVLLADDSITIQKVVGIIFANEDYELTMVDNGDAALAKAREIIPDLMLVDALMPGKNGYEVCSAARNDPALSHIPLLLLTGAFEPFDEEKAKKCGADDIISKPFESQQLIDKVHVLLERATSRPASFLHEDGPLVFPENIPEMTAFSDGPDTSAETLSAGAPEEDLIAAFFASEATADAGAVSTPEAVAGAPEDDLWGTLLSEENPLEEELLAGEEFTCAAEPEAVVEDFSGTEFPGFSSESFTETALPFVEEISDMAELVGEFPVSEEEDFLLAEELSYEELALGDVTVEEGELLTEAPDFLSEASEPLQDAEASFEPEEQPFAFDFALEPSQEQFLSESDCVAETVQLDEEPVCTPVGAAIAAMNEDQLRTMLASMSREIIEKVVWEVVPDLAEAMIREEIRKIKGGES